MSGNSVASSLNEALRETYKLFLVTHHHHWNVEGMQFVALHTLFEEQYTEMFTAIDEIAERIRTLGEYAMPFDGKTDIVGDVKSALGGADGSDRATKMIAQLIELNDSVIKHLEIAKEAAADAEDNESEDLMIGRITVHQKSSWMLNSLTK